MQKCVRSDQEPSQQLAELLAEQLRVLEELQALAAQEHRFIVQCDQPQLSEVVARQKDRCGDLKDQTEQIKAFLFQYEGSSRASARQVQAAGATPMPTLAGWIAKHGGEHRPQLDDLTRQVEAVAAKNREWSAKNVSLLQFSLKYLRSAQALLAGHGGHASSRTYARDGQVKLPEPLGRTIQSEV